MHPEMSGTDVERARVRFDFTGEGRCRVFQSLVLLWIAPYVFPRAPTRSCCPPTDAYVEEKRLVVVRVNIFCIDLRQVHMRQSLLTSVTTQDNLMANRRLKKEETARG